jgi:hypothetical protein
VHLSNRFAVFVSFSTSLFLQLEYRCCIDRLKSQPVSGYSPGVNFGDVNNWNRPIPALGAYSSCNEYAAVIKQITHPRNTSLRTPNTYRFLAI